eukprot:9751100-Alexandrium_andersonii.AAC.1
MHHSAASSLLQFRAVSSSFPLVLSGAARPPRTTVNKRLSGWSGAVAPLERTSRKLFETKCQTLLETAAKCLQRCDAFAVVR